MSGPDIFISYSREDRAAARHFADSFTNEGFSVWWDAVIRSGQTFDEVIEKALRSSKACVVLWSPRSVSSRWVRAEATLADRLNKLVPAIIERCDLPIIFELTHATDLADWSGDTSDSRWQSLVSDLRRVVGDSEQADAPAPEPAKLAAKPIEVEARPAVAAKSAAPEPNPLKASEDELMAALERLSKARASKLAAKTPQEVEQQQFYKQSDDQRAQETDKVHCLIRLDPNGEESRVVISPAGLRIGRSAPADLIVADASVSRAHCLVELAADKVRVTDLNSTNGTFIDGKRLDRSAILPLGSVLRVGNATFEHEVRQRSELQQPIDPASFDPGDLPREARIARH